MELFSFSLSGIPILLSASENGLFLHPIRNEHFGHPFLLCSGYKTGFSGCIYNDSLYYAYINRENLLLLRRLHESVLLFRPEINTTVIYREPQLIVFNNILFLFYSEEESNSYRIKLRLPFSDTTIRLPESIQTAYPEPPHLSVQATEHYLYLFLTVGTSSISYRYTREGNFEPICTEAEHLSTLRLPWEAEKKQLEQGLMQAIRLSEQQQNLLSEKEQTLQLTTAKLTECEQNRQQTAQTLAHTTNLLDRAKSQYNELMQVAEQYRQEAMKWYGKFTDRH